MVHNHVALLGFLSGSAFVSKVLAWKYDGDRDDDLVVVICGEGECPLKELVSDRQSSSSESDGLPAAGGRVCCEGEG